MTELQRCELAKVKGYTYCPMTGIIRGMKGNAIISKNKYGYTHIQLYTDKLYTINGHRLAWFLHYGNIPNKLIDHIDGNPSNNKIENLRDVTTQQNSFNRTTAKGYYFDKGKKKYKAQIRLNKKCINLGWFIDKEEAHAAYLKAKAKYHVIK